MEAKLLTAMTLPATEPASWKRHLEVLRDHRDLKAHKDRKGRRAFRARKALKATRVPKGHKVRPVRQEQTVRPTGEETGPLLLRTRSVMLSPTVVHLMCATPHTPTTNRPTLLIGIRSLKKATPALKVHRAQQERRVQPAPRD